MAFATQATLSDRFLVVSSPGNGGSFQAGPGSSFPDKSFVLNAGTTISQINKAYIDTYAITNGGTTSLDLTACTYAGTLQNFAAVKYIKVSIGVTTTADTNPQVTFGPMGLADSAVLCFGATTGQQDVRQMYVNSNAVSGWAVTASNKVVQFRNDGTYPINLSVMFLGRG